MYKYKENKLKGLERVELEGSKKVHIKKRYNSESGELEAEDRYECDINVLQAKKAQLQREIESIDLLITDISAL